MSMRNVIAVLLMLFVNSARADEVLPTVLDVELQPLAAQVQRLSQALEAAGSPLSSEQQGALAAAAALSDEKQAVRQIQATLDPLCLAAVHINPESRVKSIEGPAPKKLMEHGWRTFLVKVWNEGGVTSELRCTSPNSLPLHDSSNDASPPAEISQQDVMNRWLDIEVPGTQPLKPRLSGLALEYRILELHSRDVGQREAKLSFDVGQGTQDLGFRSALPILFECQPSVPVTLRVLDEHGSPTMASFTFRDEQGRVYPARSRRLAPDFFFHDQIYRSNGETVRLPPGKYSVEYSRGPEYKVLHSEIAVPAAQEYSAEFRLERWIDMAHKGWYSGDHHVHAAGCSHYSSPAQGVTPADMMRHILGEDLNVGCVLTWGPCWYFQKQFFDGQTSKLSQPGFLMRYDVEVSGFPSSHSGHLVLLRLQEDDYPGTEKIEDWPSWDLPILQWAKNQGGIVGFAHSGWGLEVAGTALPTYEVPPYDGIGANEYVVDVTHDLVDFISSVDTPAVWELNMWYHTLNCGFTTRISGETDFPCIYDQRVGLGRSYVKLAAGESLDFDHWVKGIKDGRCYSSDGRTHLFDFTVNGLGVGESGADGRASFLSISSGEPLAIRARAASLLEPEPREDIRQLPLDAKPYWHTERARLGNSRRVAVELVVNGEAVDRKEITADGSESDVEFDYRPERSCWVALRVFPAAHTNPVFVEVDDQPIRASKRSAEWCLKGVDQCWESKEPAIRESERAEAEAAYEHARQVYRTILDEAFDDRA